MSDIVAVIMAFGAKCGAAVVVLILATKAHGLLIGQFRLDVLELAEYWMMAVIPASAGGDVKRDGVVLIVGNTQIPNL